jgi:uncharacterized Zn finger protein (UPF0148 family)
MGFLDMNVCPNEECPKEQIADKKVTICPECGTTLITLRAGSKEVIALFKAKKEKAPKARPKALLISDEMTDEAIKGLIQQDMINLQSSEAGTGWMRLGTLLSGNSTDQMLGAGFKALINQNKIIIRQNELLLRALNKLNEK